MLKYTIKRIIMKKLLTICFSLLMGLSVYAQNNPIMYFSKVESSDEVEHKYYTYNENMQAVASEELFNDGMMVVDSLFYNDLGQVTRQGAYQLINGEWRNVNYIDYTYYENGLRATRKNYNNFGGQFELGGIYTYTYDENNNLIYWELYFAGGIYQTCERSYNELNQVVQELGYQYSDNSWKIDYSYDSENRLISQFDYFWDSGSWMFYSKTLYAYDDNSNSILIESYTQNILTQYSEFTFDETVTLDQVIFPENPEDEWPTFGPSQNIVRLEKHYRMDNNGQMQYYCDYIYTYEPIGGPAPIITVSPTSLTYNVECCTEFNDNKLVISNSGSLSGEYSASIVGENTDWLLITNATSGTVAPGQTSDLNLELYYDNLYVGSYQAIIKIETNDPNNLQIEVPVTLNITVGIDEVIQKTLIYPNPANDFVKIQSDGVQSIEIYNVMGKLMYSEEMYNGTIQVDLSDFSSGMYLLNLKTENGSFNSKLVVK